MALIALLAGCSAAPPAVAERSATVAMSRTPLPLRGPSRYVASTWSFSVLEHACVARSVSPELTIAVSVEAVGAMTISVQTSQLRHGGGRGAAEFSFSGAAGRWKLRAQARGPGIVANTPVTERSLDNLLSLLGGGRLAVLTTDGSLPGLDVPDAGVAGRDWFGCARSRAGASG